MAKKEAMNVECIMGVRFLRLLGIMGFNEAKMTASDRRDATR